MLKIHTKLDDVPEALREHYTLVDGRYVPQLSDDHPVLVNNKALVSEKATAKARITELEADLDEAKKTSVPRGHTVVAKADAELLDKYKASGTPDEVATRLAEHKSLKDESDRHKLDDSRRQVAKALGYTNVDAFIRLPNLPEFEIRGEGDKQTVVAKVKDGDKVVEKDARQFMESSPDHAPFLPALSSEQGVTVHGSSGADGKQPDPFQSARDWAKNYNEVNKQQTASLESRFGAARSA